MSENGNGTKRIFDISRYSSLSRKILEYFEEGRVVFAGQVSKDLGTPFRGTTFALNHLKRDGILGYKDGGDDSGRGYFIRPGVELVGLSGNSNGHPKPRKEKVVKQRSRHSIEFRDNLLADVRRHPMEDAYSYAARLNVNPIKTGMELRTLFNKGELMRTREGRILKYFAAVRPDNPEDIKDARASIKSYAEKHPGGMASAALRAIGLTASAGEPLLREMHDAGEIEYTGLFLRPGGGRKEQAAPVAVEPAPNPQKTLAVSVSLSNATPTPDVTPTVDEQRLMEKRVSFSVEVPKDIKRFLEAEFDGGTSPMQVIRDFWKDAQSEDSAKHAAMALRRYNGICIGMSDRSLLDINFSANDIREVETIQKELAERHGVHASGVSRILGAAALYMQNGNATVEEKESVPQSKDYRWRLSIAPTALDSMEIALQKHPGKPIWFYANELGLSRQRAMATLDKLSKAGRASRETGKSGVDVWNTPESS
ncbi:MAG: hypothetical protein HYS81_05060 [Candidatus Aenigmatarchaeota archaeon]|nr:MAG: hypothetical protein HYS81_05060 [Candidatus Aenigmarchaeota archaeon]